MAASVCVVAINATEGGVMPPYSSLAQWVAAGRLVTDGHSEHQFVIGQWMAEGLKAFPEKNCYREAQQVTGLSRGTLYNVAWVHSSTISLRSETAMSKSDLTWHHYKALAALEPEDQRDWFNRAVEKKMSARELAKALKKPPTNTPKNDPLSRLAYLRQVSVKELTAGIVREYLARPEVVSEMAEASETWTAAEFVAPDQESEGEKRTQVIYNATKEAASIAYRLAKRDDASNEVAYRLAYNSAHHLVIMNGGDGLDAGTIALRAANAVVAKVYKDSKAAAAEEPAPAPEPESVGV